VTKLNEHGEIEDEGAYSKEKLRPEGGLPPPFPAARPMETAITVPASKPWPLFLIFFLFGAVLAVVAVLMLSGSVGPVEEGSTDPGLPGDNATLPSTQSSEMGPGIPPTTVARPTTEAPRPTEPRQPGLRVGAAVRVSSAVTFTSPLRLRNEPGTSARILVDLPPGTTGVIIEGPVEKDRYRWWRLRMTVGANQHTGWAAEVALDGTRWLLER
jgi:hypothetical protein